MSMIGVDYGVLNQRGSPSWFSDIYANIPTAGYKGRMFISTDTFAFYRDTGTGWDLIGGPGTGTITGSGASGQVSYFNGSSTLAGSNNLFWDSTNNRLGIGTATPGVALDIHATGTNAQFNGTGTNNAYLVFQNSGTSKWRIGNTYGAGANIFSIFNYTTTSTPFQISNTTNQITINGAVDLGTNTLTAGASVTINGTTGIAGMLHLKNDTNLPNLGNGYASIGSTSFNQILFATYNSTNGKFGLFDFNSLSDNTSRTYTLPNASGTLALTSQIPTISGTTNTLAKFTSSSAIGNSGVSDDGSNLTYLSSAKATLLVKAANNSYYGQLAFTNGSNAAYGGISYNNSGQYMQFETNTSEWMRLNSNGNFLIGTTTDAGYKLDINGTGRFISTLITADSLLVNATSQNGTASKIYVKQSSDSAFRGINIVSSTSAEYVGGMFMDGTGNFNIAQSYLGSGSYQSLAFLTSGTERLRISSSGNVLIGTSTDYGYKVFIEVPDLNNQTILALRNATNNGGGQFITFQNYQNSQAGYISQLTATTILYASSSDYRLKENILPMQNAIDRILKIKPVTYNWKNSNNEIGEGFIAHELQEIVPLAVGGKKDEINEDGSIKIQGIDYGKLTPLLVKAIQELNEKLVRNNIN